MQVALFVAMLAGCSGNNGGEGAARDGTAYGPPWASQIFYRQLFVNSLNEMDEALDTGGEAGTIHYAWTEETDDETRWWVSEGDDRTGTAYLDLTFSGKGVQMVAAPDALDTPIVLVESSFKSGDAVTSGSVTATVTLIDALTTWYGTFYDVVQVDLSGGTPTGQLRFAEGIGIIQFSVGTTAGELAWYQ
jgi:hypothetical protein